MGIKLQNKQQINQDTKCAQYIVQYMYNFHAMDA